jgi:hypothetical protein
MPDILSCDVPNAFPAIPINIRQVATKALIVAFARWAGVVSFSVLGNSLKVLAQLTPLPAGVACE